MNTDKFMSALTHPVTTVLGAALSIGAIAKVPVLSAAVATLWSNAGLLFSIVSIGGTQLNARFGFIPPVVVNALILVAGVLFLAKSADTLYDKFQGRINP